MKESVFGDGFRHGRGVELQVSRDGIVCMIEKMATIRNEQGIHCRPSAKIVTEAIRFHCQIRVLSEAGEADLHSLLSLVSLGLQAGTTVRIQVTGDDEETVCSYFVELFETHFDFPQETSEGRAGWLNFRRKG